MDRMIYTALTGMDAAMNRQRTVASNLANASTPGFRAETFATTPSHMRGDMFDVRGFAQGAVRGADDLVGDRFAVAELEGKGEHRRGVGGVTGRM